MRTMQIHAQTLLHTSGAPVLKNVIVPYNVVCTSSIPICTNQLEIINAIQLMAEL